MEMTTPKDSASIEAFEAFFNSTPIEDRTMEIRKMYWSCWQAALRSVEPAKIVLPQRKQYSESPMMDKYQQMESQGFNKCIDTTKRLNAGAAFKIEGE